MVVPKLIHPIPPAISSPETSPERHMEDTWMQVTYTFILARTLMSLVVCGINPICFLENRS